MWEDKMLVKETDRGKQKMKETKAYVVREFKSHDFKTCSIDFSCLCCM